nr:serine hydrolase domain-containing protein [Tamaricihabitans halophyticus]
MLGSSALGSSALATTQEELPGRFDQPHTGFAPAETVLRPGTPEEVGLDRAPLARAAEQVASWTEPAPDTGHPLYSGAVTLLAHQGVVVDRQTSGKALRYADAEGTELPPAEQLPMRPDTIFDIASISKLFTSIAVLQLAENGALDINEPVASYLPEFGVNGKSDITVEQLLTHTSGLEPTLNLWRDYPDKPSRINAVLEVAPQEKPGSAYLYSDLNLITLGVLVERRSGSTLDEFVRDRITEPLAMTDTGYNPPADKRDRIAATEYTAEPPRGLVHGEVHDENAWSLGGVAGHAGVFSTATDLAKLGQAVLNGGSYAGNRILRQETVEQMLTNYNQEFPDDSHGLGFELDQRWYMGGLSAPGTAGHTGFTGTSLVLDPASRSIAILLTNRVHPSRDWGSINEARETHASGLAAALAVPPRHGPDSWHSAPGNSTTTTLSTARLPVQGTPEVTFDAFIDSEKTDKLTVAASTDGQRWQPLELEATGPGAPEGGSKTLSGSGHRSWWSVKARLDQYDPPNGGTLTLRWQFATDDQYTGRGVNLDGIQVKDDSGLIFDAERDPQKLEPEGWVTTSR